MNGRMSAVKALSLKVKNERRKGRREVKDERKGKLRKEKGGGFAS